MKSNLKDRFLATIGHVPAAHASADATFDRLRKVNPDLFPVPRGTESFWDAIAGVVASYERAR